MYTHYDALGREIKPDDILLVKGYCSATADTIAKIVRINRVTITVQTIRKCVNYYPSFIAEAATEQLRRYSSDCVVITAQHLANKTDIPRQEQAYLSATPKFPHKCSESVFYDAYYSSLNDNFIDSIYVKNPKALYAKGLENQQALVAAYPEYSI